MVEIQVWEANPRRSTALAEPPERLLGQVLELVLLAAGLEAHLSEVQVRALYGAQEDGPLFQELCHQQVRSLAFGSTVAQPYAALERRLEALAEVPSTLAQRREALRLARRFSLATGCSLEEALLLGILQLLLGLEGEEL